MMKRFIILLLVLVLSSRIVQSMEVTGTLDFSSKKTYTLDGVGYQIYFYGFTPNPSQCNFQINGGGSDPNGDWAPDMKNGDTFTSTKLPIAIYINNCDLSVRFAEKVTFTLKSSTPAPVVIKPNCANECLNHNQRYCVGNNVYSCFVVDGCWKESLVDTCPNNELWKCVNDKCVYQVPNGCAYNNPDCSSGYDCVDNTCIKRQIGCEQGWACKDDFNS